MNAKTKGIGLNQAFTKALDTTWKKAEIIGKQLKEAEEEYPEMASALKLLLAYNIYSADQARIGALTARLRGTVSYTPSPEPGPVPWPIPWPIPGLPPDPDLCKFVPDVCPCAEGDLAACDFPDLGPEPIDPCESLCASYKEALECALQYCDKPNLTEAESQEWVRCQQNIDKYWDKLVARRCVNPRTYIATLEELLRIEFQVP